MSNAQHTPGPKLERVEISGKEYFRFDGYYGMYVARGGKMTTMDLMHARFTDLRGKIDAAIEEKKVAA